MLGLRDEGRGSIVDQHVERRLAPDRVHHALDRRAIANVAADGGDLAAGLTAHLRSGRLQPIELAATDDELRAEREETPTHRSAKSRAATGHQDALVLEQTCFKHRLNPS